MTLRKTVPKDLKQWVQETIPSASTNDLTLSPQQVQLIQALRAGVIDWFQYFEHWRKLDDHLEAEKKGKAS